jgi:hypothetical protein
MGQTNDPVSARPVSPLKSNKETGRIFFRQHSDGQGFITIFKSTIAHHFLATNLLGSVPFLTSLLLLEKVCMNRKQV